MQYVAIVAGMACLYGKKTTLFIQMIIHDACVTTFWKYAVSALNGTRKIDVDFCSIA